MSISVCGGIDEEGEALYSIVETIRAAVVDGALWWHKATERRRRRLHHWRW